MRRQEYLTWLTKDVQLSQTCYETRTKLLHHLQRQPDISAYFQVPPALPFKIPPSRTLPPHAVILQKMVNFLFDAGQRMNQLREQYESIAADRSAYAQELAQPLSKVVALLQDVLVMLEDNPHIKDLVGNHLDELTPKLNIILESFALFQTRDAEGVALASLGPVPQVKPQVKPGPGSSSPTPMTLYDQINTLKLSNEMHDFLNTTLRQFLLQNLDESVIGSMPIGTDGFFPKAIPPKDKPSTGWGEFLLQKAKGILDQTTQALSPKETFPMENYIDDTEELQLYKNILNAFSRIEKTLIELESCSGMAFSEEYAPLMAELNRDMRLLDKAREKPLMNEIIQTGLGILKPLISMPYLHMYLLPSRVEQEGPIEDIFKAWKVQKSPVPSKVEVSAPKEEPLHSIEAFLLTKFPDLTDSIKAFCQRVGLTTNDHTSLGKISLALSKQDVSVQSLIDFGVSLVSLADTSDFEMGLKKDLLSNPFIQQFSALLTSMLKCLPLENDQARLTAEIDWTNRVYESRVTSEKARLEALRNDESYETLLVAKHPDFDRLEPIFDGIVSIFNMMETPKSKVMIHKPEIQTLYLQLHPFLKDYPEFTKSYVTSAVVEADLKKVLQGLMEICSHILEPLSDWEILYDMHLDKELSFIQDETKHKFLTHYHAIQPFLQKIDSRYDLKFFLRNLQTPDDFAEELRKIHFLKPELQNLIDIHHRVKIEKMALCQKRLDFLETLNDVKVEMIAQLTTSFESEMVQRSISLKEQIFQQFMDDHKSELEEEFGDGYIATFTAPVFRDKFLSKIGRDVKDIKQAITNGLIDLIEVHRSIKKTQQEKVDEINAGIQKEQLLSQKNLSRVEKISVLKKLADSLKARGVSADTNREEAQTGMREVTQALIDHDLYYAKMIKAYDILSDMEAYLKEKYPDTYTTADHLIAKRQELQRLKDMLANDKTTPKPESRLKQVNDRLAGSESKKILEKNADPWWLKCLQWLVSCVYVPREKKTITFFHSKVEEMPTTQATEKEHAGTSTFSKKRP
ncbi:MAG: hypothetical protein NTW94_01120 [Legionellales bacterium]|nr:hypothetical protein [Legionellales bacterium]